MATKATTRLSPNYKVPKRHRKQVRGGQPVRVAHQVAVSAPSHATGHLLAETQARRARGNPVEAPGPSTSATQRLGARRTKSKPQAMKLAPTTGLPAAPKSSAANERPSPLDGMPRSRKSKPGATATLPTKFKTPRSISPVQSQGQAANLAERAGRAPSRRAKAKGRVAPMVDLPSLANVIQDLDDYQRRRRAFQQASLRLNNQIGALKRRAAGEEWAEFVTLELAVSKKVLDGHLKGPESAMTKLAKGLPVYPWVKATHGAGILGLAQIVAECGDLGNFANPAKLWCRMGLAVFGGQRQRRVSGPDAIEQHYSPRRRAIMFNVGECFIRAGRGPYYDLYLERKAFEATKPACGKPLTGGKICDVDGHCKPGHIHNRARRYIEKRYLRDLWREWRRAKSPTPPMGSLPVAIPAEAVPA